MPRPVLKTPLTERLGIEYPIILAGMGAGNEGGAAGPELVAAVSEAGGLGVLGGTGRNLDDFHEACAKIRKLTKKPFGVDLLLPQVSSSSVSLPPERERLGEGPSDLDPRYKAWADDIIHDLGLAEPSHAAERGGGGAWGGGEERIARHIEAILEEKPAVFAAGLGSPARYVPALHQAGITVFGLVGNVKTARKVKADGVDVIVAQGHEAGGHTGRIGTFALVPQVIDAVNPMPVVLAGGVGSGRSVAAAFALGAQAVWCGTIFLATPEANITDAHRQHLVAATEEDTRVSRVYSGKTARALVNPVIESWERSGLPALPMGLQSRLSGRVQLAARNSGRPDLMMQLGGQIAGSLTAVRPAAAVLDQLVRETVDVLSHLQGRVTYSTGG